MGNIVIQEAKTEDAKALIDYTNKIGAETDNLTFGAEGMSLSVEEECAFIENMKKDAHSVFYCAWKGSELVGTASLSGLPRRMSHRASLSISVLKSEWNQGIGTMLMEQLITYGKNNGIEIINLEVRSDNGAAIHLYEKYGFQKTGCIPGFFKIGKEYVDFDLMSLDMR